MARCPDSGNVSIIDAPPRPEPLCESSLTRHPDRLYVRVITRSIVAMTVVSLALIRLNLNCLAKHLLPGQDDVWETAAGRA